MLHGNASRATLLFGMTTLFMNFLITVQQIATDSETLQL